MCKKEFLNILKVMFLLRVIPSFCQETNETDCARKIKECKQMEVFLDCSVDESHVEKKMCFHQLIEEMNCTSHTQIIHNHLIDIVLDCECYYAYAHGIETACPRSRYHNAVKFKEFVERNPTGQAACCLTHLRHRCLMADFTDTCRTSKTNATVNDLLQLLNKKYKKLLDDLACNERESYDLFKCEKHKDGARAVCGKTIILLIVIVNILIDFNIRFFLV